MNSSRSISPDPSRPAGQTAGRSPHGAGRILGLLVVRSELVLADLAVAVGVDLLQDAVFSGRRCRQGVQEFGQVDLAGAIGVELLEQGLGQLGSRS